MGQLNFSSSYSSYRRSRRISSTSGILAVFVAVLIFYLVIGFSGGLTRPEETKIILEGNGYSNITITGWGPFYCGRDDLFATTFIATSPNKSMVKGVVCRGIFKNNTIRFVE